jgi:hypothetical protein
MDFILFWVVCFVSIVIAIIILSIESKEGDKEYKIKSDNYLSNVDFTISKRVPINHMLEFLVDNNKRQIAIFSCKPNIRFFSCQERISKENFSINIFNFSDINSFELLLDNDEVIQGKALAATAGSLIFGTAGAVIGSSGKKKVEKANRSIVLNIYLNKIDCPVITINFPIIQDGDLLSDMVYNKILENAQTIKGILHYIQQQNNNSKANNNNENDITNKIKQLNELKGQGLISEEEFNNKKKELLDNL